MCAVMTSLVDFRWEDNSSDFICKTKELEVDRKGNFCKGTYISNDFAALTPRLVMTKKIHWFISTNCVLCRTTSKWVLFAIIDIFYYWLVWIYMFIVTYKMDLLMRA